MSVVSTAILAATLLFATAGPAQASVCWALSCVGHDPVVYGCTVSTTTTNTVQLNGVVLATIWNRYSSNCRTNWGRGQLSQAALNLHYKMDVSITTNNDSEGEYEGMCYPGPSDKGTKLESCAGYPPYGGPLPAYTDMVDGVRETTADVAVYDSTGQHLIAWWFVTQ